MEEKGIQKNLEHRMNRRFLFAAFICLSVISVYSALIIFLDGRISPKTEESADTAELKEVEGLSAQIDEIPIGGNQQTRLKELKNAYESFPDRLKEGVGTGRYDKLLEADELEKTLKANNGGLVIKDKSPNRYDLDLAKGGVGHASLKRYGGCIALEGQADILADGSKEALRKLFSANGSFTIEAVLNPNDSGYYNKAFPDDPDNYNMVVSKGDHCMGLRISQQSVQFFIWNTDQKWMNVKADLSRQQLNSWIHVAGIYDGENVMVYLENSGMHVLPNAGSLVASDYPLAVGYCPETGRDSTVSIQSLRIYGRALTQEELDGGNVHQKDAVLWYDFSDVTCPWLNMEASGIRANEKAARIDVRQEIKLSAEPIPYYAAGEIVYETNDPQTAMVSQDGTVLGVADGLAVITAKLKGTDFSVKIPVQVGRGAFSAAVVLDWLVQRLFLMDLAAFALALFFIAFLQRKQMILGAANLAAAVGELGRPREEELLPDLPEAREPFDEAKERFRQKDMMVYETEKKKTELMAYLAHDLKTPIASTAGYLMLLRDEEQISPEMRKRYAEIALNNARRLNELIEEFFEITRFNISQIKLEYQEINLTWFLEQLVSEFAPMFAKKGLACRLDVPRDVRFICDPDKMERVFDNLLRNAINYSYRDTEIKITVQTGKEMTFICENEGNTIPGDKLARIFEQLYRLDFARSSDTGGSGLGLAIAKQIVELHGGEIFAESRDNRIRFTVKIPVTV